MLYPQILGSDFNKLPRALRDFHRSPDGGRATGTVTVEHANQWLARLVGFPAPGQGIPLSLRVVAKGDREVWTRQFGAEVRRSEQRQAGDLLLEEMGPVRVYFRVQGDRAGLRFQSQRARLWILPLPLHVSAEAHGDDTSWRFQVTVAHVGSYRGAMAPES